MRHLNNQSNLHVNEDAAIKASSLTLNKKKESEIIADWQQFRISLFFFGSPAGAIFEIKRIPEASSSAKVIVFVPLL